MARLRAHLGDASSAGASPSVSPQNPWRNLRRAAVVLRVHAGVRRAAFVLLACAAAVGPAPLLGCGTGPSHVSQGLRYASQDPTYDRYFDALHATQVELGAAPDEEATLRRQLAEAVGTTDTATEPLLAAVEKEMERMSAAGLTLSLTVSDPGASPAAKVEVTSGLPEETDARIVKAIEETAQGEAALAARMDAARARVEELELNTGTLLLGVSDTFRKAGPIRKAEVRSNLEDAQKLFPLMRARATETSARAQAIVDGLVRIANTTPPAPEPAAEPPPAPAPAAKPSRTSGTRSGTSAPAKPAKPAKPATSDGFEP
jgi:hypothetical protein